MRSTLGLLQSSKIATGAHRPTLQSLIRNQQEAEQEKSETVFKNARSQLTISVDSLPTVERIPTVPSSTTATNNKTNNNQFVQKNSSKKQIIRSSASRRLHTINYRAQENASEGDTSCEEQLSKTNSDDNYWQMLQEMLLFAPLMREQQQAIKSALLRIEQLENMLRLRKKEMDSLRSMNEFYCLQLKKKDEIYRVVVEETLAQKDQIKELQQKLNTFDKERNKDRFRVIGDLLNENIAPERQASQQKQNGDQKSQQLKNVNHSNINVQSVFEAENGNHSKAESSQLLKIQKPNQTLQPITSTKTALKRVSIPSIDSPTLKKQTSAPLNLLRTGVPGRSTSTLNRQLTKFNLSQHFDSEQQLENVNNQQRSNFMQHSTDYQFFQTLLDMNLTDEEVEREYSANRFNGIVQEVTSSEQRFKTYLSKLERESFVALFESINYNVHSQELFLKLILKLKKIIDGVSIMHSSLILQDAFATIVDQTCKILDCDRASVFLVDYKKNELWTKVAKGTTSIRIPNGTGLVGHVAQKGETLNILDAHQDQRFNRDVDKKNNYRTKTVLAVPIYDQQRQIIIGVLQAINKFNGFFTKDDEGLIKILARLAQVVLRNSIYHDEKLAFHNSLRQLLKVGIILNAQKSLQKLMLVAEKKLVESFDCPEIRLYHYDEQNQRLFRYMPDGSVKEYPSNAGICADVIQKNVLQFISNNYAHPLFNGLVDIETQMPVIHLPLYASVGTEKIKIGVLQAVNSKGIEDIAYSRSSGSSSSNTPKAFYETLQNFSVILGQAMFNLIHPERLAEAMQLSEEG